MVLHEFPMFTNTKYFNIFHILFQNIPKLHQIACFTMLYIQDCYPTTQAYGQQHPTSTPNKRSPCDMLSLQSTSSTVESWRHGAWLKALALATTVGVSPGSKLPKNQNSIDSSIFTETWSSIFVPFEVSWFCNILKNTKRLLPRFHEIAELPLLESTKKEIQPVLIAQKPVFSAQNSMLRDRNEGKRIQLYLERAVLDSSNQSWKKQYNLISLANDVYSPHPGYLSSHKQSTDSECLFWFHILNPWSSQNLGLYNASYMFPPLLSMVPPKAV